MPFALYVSDTVDGGGVGTLEPRNSRSSQAGLILILHSRIFQLQGEMQALSLGSS